METYKFDLAIFWGDLRLSLIMGSETKENEQLQKKSKQWISAVLSFPPHIFFKTLHPVCCVW